MAEIDTSETGAPESDKPASESEKTPADTVMRWLAELELADKAEEGWRKEAKEIWDLYEGDKTKAFNILWSNTETVSPSVYNSTPVPDVRRRFRDPDPVGKQASKILERALAYSMDVYDFNDEVASVVLDAELLGRGVGRYRYKPTFAPMDQAQPGLWSRLAQGAKKLVGIEPQPPEQIVVDERTELEHVQWDKFRRGPGKRWPDVPWVSFEHEFTREMAEEEFGPDVAALLTYQDVENADKLSVRDDGVKQLFKVCIVHEIWDKVRRRVLFIAPCYKDAPCKEVADELQLEGFFPMPRPIYSIRNSRTLVPTPRYRMYQKKAEQLERISARIDKVAQALRIRGAYASNLEDIAKILEADDGDMIAVSNTSAIQDAGGLDKMIWLMPLDRLAIVLDQLYKAAAQVKQEIYEIVGLSDIMRGATRADETLGAQELKSQWGSVRLENYKREIQRFARDVLRGKAEIICQRFSQQTLAAITNVQLPTAEQKAMAQQAIHQARLAQQPPMQEAQELLALPTWDEVMAILHSDFMRGARIDIETDSTVAETVNRDMASLTEVTRAVGEVVGGALPAVQSGMVPVDAVKQIAIAITRRARLGQPLEDAFDAMQQPAPEAPAPQEPPQDDGSKQRAAELKIQLATEQSQRELDNREHDLDVRELGLSVREKDLQKREGEVQRGAQIVQKQAQQVMQ